MIIDVSFFLIRCVVVLFRRFLIYFQYCVLIVLAVSFFCRFECLPKICRQNLSLSRRKDCGWFANLILRSVHIIVAVHSWRRRLTVLVKHIEMFEVMLEKAIVDVWS